MVIKGETKRRSVEDVDEADDGLPACFIAMPIQKSDTLEHKHFSAIYETIALVVEAAGFEALRADKVALPGNINRDIITRLALAPLVIADLTDLNPNVFYEVGLRHAIRRNGTILLIDKQRSPSIPFDLSQYRVIQYEGDVPGVLKLRIDLTEAFRDITDAKRVLTAVDSPLHDWFPELPADIIASSRASTDADLVAELAGLRRQVQYYQEDSVKRDQPRPISAPRTLAVIQSIRQSAEAGELPHDYVAAGADAVESSNVPAFLDATEKLLRSVQVPGINVFFRFGNWASVLGLSELRIAILHEASTKLNTKEAESAYLRAMSRSENSENRAFAREQIAAAVGLDLSTGELAEPISGQDPDELANNVGHFVELLHEEGDDEFGLKILEGAMERPDSYRFQRDWARQLDWSDRKIEAFDQYRNAIDSPRVSQESLRWFGNFLHNNGLHVHAAEVFLLEGYIDLSDPNGPLSYANDLSYQIYDYFAISTPEALIRRVGGDRELPPAVGVDTVANALKVAINTGPMLPTQRDMLEKVAIRADLRESVAETGPISKAARTDWLREQYVLLQSELTAGSPVAARLLGTGI